MDTGGGFLRERRGGGEVLFRDLERGVGGGGWDEGRMWMG